MCSCIYCDKFSKSLCFSTCFLLLSTVLSRAGLAAFSIYPVAVQPEKWQYVLQGWLFKDSSFHLHIKTEIHLLSMLIVSTGILQLEHFFPLGFVKVFMTQVVYWLYATKSMTMKTGESRSQRWVLMEVWSMLILLQFWFYYIGLVQGSHGIWHNKISYKVMFVCYSNSMSLFYKIVHLCSTRQHTFVL